MLGLRFLISICPSRSCSSLCFFIPTRSAEFGQRNEFAEQSELVQRYLVLRLFHEIRRGLPRWGGRLGSFCQLISFPKLSRLFSSGNLVLHNWKACLPLVPSLSNPISSSPSRILTSQILVSIVSNPDSFHKDFRKSKETLHVTMRAQLHISRSLCSSYSWMVNRRNCNPSRFPSTPNSCTTVMRMKIPQIRNYTDKLFEASCISQCGRVPTLCFPFATFIGGPWPTLQLTSSKTSWSECPRLQFEPITLTHALDFDAGRTWSARSVRAQSFPHFVRFRHSHRSLFL